MWKKTINRKVQALLFGCLPSVTLAAQTGVNVWESLLSRLVDSLMGPVAYAISCMALFVCGAIMAATDLQSGAKNFVTVACGISIAISGAHIVTGFLGFSGALIV